MRVARGGAPVFGAKGDGIWRDGDEPLVREADAVGAAAEVLEEARGAAEPALFREVQDAFPLPIRQMQTDYGNEFSLAFRLNGPRGRGRASLHPAPPAAERQSRT